MKWLKPGTQHGASRALPLTQPQGDCPLCLVCAQAMQIAKNIIHGGQQDHKSLHSRERKTEVLRRLVLELLMVISLLLTPFATHTHTHTHTHRESFTSLSTPGTFLDGPPVVSVGERGGQEGENGREVASPDTF